MTKCEECGLEGNFAGYHGVGPKSVSLCMACAEATVHMWRIRQRDENSGGYYAHSQDDALAELDILLKEDEVGGGYSVTIEEKTIFEKYSMTEFHGF